MEWFDSLVPAAVGSGMVSGLGVWVVVRMVIHYQREFVKEYQAELDKARAELEISRKAHTRARELHEACLNEKTRLRQILIKNGIPYEKPKEG